MINNEITAAAGLEPSTSEKSSAKVCHLYPLPALELTHYSSSAYFGSY
jgi:hypothetical protein